jgi:hypothetical protein
MQRFRKFHNAAAKMMFRDVVAKFGLAGPPSKPVVNNNGSGAASIIWTESDQSSLGGAIAMATVGFMIHAKSAKS